MARCPSAPSLTRYPGGENPQSAAHCGLPSPRGSSRLPRPRRRSERRRMVGRVSLAGRSTLTVVPPRLFTYFDASAGLGDVAVTWPAGRSPVLGYGRVVRPNALDHFGGMPVAIVLDRERPLGSSGSRGWPSDSQPPSSRHRVSAFTPGHSTFSSYWESATTVTARPPPRRSEHVSPTFARQRRYVVEHRPDRAALRTTSRRLKTRAESQSRVASAARSISSRGAQALSGCRPSVRAA